MPSDAETGGQEEITEVAEEVSQEGTEEAVTEAQEVTGEEVGEEGQEEVGEEVQEEAGGEEQVQEEAGEEQVEGEGGQEDVEQEADGQSQEEPSQVAEEGGDEPPDGDAGEEDDEPMQKKKKKKKKNGGRQYIEEEAEVSSDEEVSADEEVGSDGDIDGLIDDEELPEAPRRKRKRGARRKKKHEDLVQDDYDLVQDALGRKIERNVDEDVDNDEDSDEEEKRKRVRLKKPKARVVVEDVVPLEPLNHEGAQGEEEPEGEEVGGEDEGMYDDPNDLREKELEEEWERRQRLDLIFEDFSTFMDTMRGQELEDDEDQKEEDELEEDDSDDETSEGKPRPKTQAQLEQEIWKFDCPERLQSRELKRLPLSADELEEDIRDETQWIYDHAFSGHAPAQWRCSSAEERTIMDNFIYRNTQEAKKPQAVDTINAVLTFIRTSRYEIPVIAEYKRDYLSLDSSGLTDEDLYLIDEWDDKWANMSRRRARLLKMNSKILFCSEHCNCVVAADSFQEDQQACILCSHDMSAHQIDSTVVELTKSASDQVELDDIQDFLKFIQLIEEIALDDEEDKPKVKKGARKRVVPNGLQAVNRLSKVTGLKSLIAKLGISARQFGENLLHSHSQHRPPAMSEDLNELAADLIGPKLPTVEAVLRAVRRVASSQLINDPLIRQSIRKKWAENAVVSTFPTTKGVREINWAHPYFEVKRIVQKPVPLFQGPMFLKLVQAAKEGFITYSIFIPPKTKSSLPPDPNAPDWLLEELKGLYCDFGLSPVDDFRDQILKDAVASLYRMAKTHCEAKLVSDAAKAVINETRENFERDHLLVTPFDETPNDKVSKWNIMSCVIGDDTEPTVFVLLNRYGDVVDHLTLHFVKDRTNTQKTDGPTSQISFMRKREDLKILKGWIESSNPTLLLIDASSLKARDFKTELRAQGLAMPIEFINPMLGKVFAKSERAEREFKEFSPLLRQAISMGRLALDPISELAGFWYQDEEAQHNDNQGAREILHLNLHPLQTMVSPIALLQVLERSFVQIVNYVGLDINKIVNRPHLQSTTQFICGLGPVKAKRLLANVMSNGYQGNRKSLAPTQTSSGEVDDTQLGQAIYENCAGFILIIGNSATKDSDVRITPLDAMRIHPDWYANAQRIAIDALEEELDENQDEDTLQEETIRVIERAMEPANHKRIDNLDLDPFAKSLDEDEQAGKWFLALTQIAEEFKRGVGFTDYRNKIQKLEKEKSTWKAMSVDQLFEALTGETEYTLREGQLVTVMVTNLKASGAVVRLSSGLRGEIRLSELSDKISFDNMGFREGYHREKRDLETVESILTQYQTVQARVISINKERFLVQLSCKSGAVRSEIDADFEKDCRHRPDISEEHRHYMYKGLHPDDAKLVEDAHSKQSRSFIPRPISHYLFKNVSRKEAMVHLSSKKQGDFVIRPSTHGPTHLTITWKVVDIEPQVFFHIDIKEEDQPPNLGVGARLLIGEQVFEDLDEIVHRFVEPMVNFSNDMVSFEKFCFGAAEDVRMVLEEEKKLQPAIVPYCVSASEERPGYFIFSYIANVHVKQEFIKLTPEGFSFKHKVLTEPRALCARIKEYIRRETARWAARNSRGVPPPPPGRPPQHHSSHRSSHHPSSSSSSHASHSSHASSHASRSSHTHRSAHHNSKPHRSKSDPRVKTEPSERITLRAQVNTENVDMEM